MIELREVEFGSEDYQTCLKIRKEVFVNEQHVPEEDEVDAFEKISHHLLAFYYGIPAGASRWRQNGDYIKLERFAVLKEFRSKKIATALVARTLEDIKDVYKEKKVKLLLHSQLSAIALYKKFDFIEEGELFEECGIMHRTMTRML